MTIRELYQWAEKNNALDKELRSYDYGCKELHCDHWREYLCNEIFDVEMTEIEDNTVFLNGLFRCEGEG